MVSRVCNQRLFFPLTPSSCSTETTLHLRLTHTPTHIMHHQPRPLLNETLLPVMVGLVRVALPEKVPMETVPMATVDLIEALLPTVAVLRHPGVLLRFLLFVHSSRFYN